MKNQAFQPLVSVPNSPFNTLLSDCLVMDSLAQDIHFEDSPGQALHNRLCEMVSAQEAIEHLRNTGLLPAANSPGEHVWLRHEPTGHSLAIGIRKSQLVVEGSFADPADAPVSYMTDVCDLLSEVFIKTSSHESSFAKAV